MQTPAEREAEFVQQLWALTYHEEQDRDLSRRLAESRATTTQLNTKENILTFSAPLTRTTNTISLDLSTYDTITARNTALNSYTTTTALNTLLNTKQATLTSSTVLLGTGGSITAIDYNSLVNKPTIGNTQWTTSGTNIYYNSGNVGINCTPNTYAKLDVKGVVNSKVTPCRSRSS